MSTAPVIVNLSLLSHTNVGKTTLARTLLREDIGEVADRAHVTDRAEQYPLVQSSAGDVLLLWDTPGFGDSARLLGRLRGSENPLGWFLGQVWDRFMDRPLWCSQEAMRNGRDASDLVLYVINAGEQPQSAGYVEPEMQIMGWLGKPAVVLLNQLGPPQDASESRAEAERWRAHLAAYEFVRDVLPLDAFARCWVQEHALLERLDPLVPTEKRPGFTRLREAWRQRDRAIFERSMRLIANQIAAVALDAETLVGRRMGEKVRAWVGSVARGGSEPVDPALDQAQRALAARLGETVRRSTEELVRLHGLVGRATDEILKQMSVAFAVDRPADADKASAIGGILSGALGGLAADLAAGGLSFGAGALIGAALGAVGARSVARAYNLARGSETGTVRWSAEFMNERVTAALMRYLAVAHFGRGRGEFVTGDSPEHWRERLQVALALQHDPLDALWHAARNGASPDQLAADLTPILTDTTQAALIELYPEARAVFA